MKKTPFEDRGIWRLIAHFAVILCLVLTISLTLLNNIFWKRYIAQTLNLAVSIQDNIQKNFISEDTLADQITNLAFLTNSRILILAENGSLLFSSLSDKPTLDSYIYNHEFLEARKGSPAFNIYADSGDPIISIATPPFPLHNRSAVLFLEMPLPNWRLARRAISSGWVLTVLLTLTSIFLTFQLRKNTNYELISDSGREEGKENVVKDFADDRISRLSTLFTSLNDGIILFDLKGNIQMINPQAKRFIKIGNEVFFSDTWSFGQHDPIIAVILQEVQYTLETQVNSEFDLQIKDDLIVQVSTSIIKSKYRPFPDFGVLAILRDITEIKEAEQQRIDFVSNVSHELRTPLALISGFVETLKGWEEMGEKNRTRALQIIDVEIRRLNNLISQLLKLSRIEHQIYVDERNIFNALQVISDSLPLIEIMAKEKKQEFIVTIPDGIAYIHGVAEWLKQIVSNLCDNAVKYTPERGKIYFTVSLEGDLIISVLNEGIVIPENERRRIFDRFYRSDLVQKRGTAGGSGLGLALVEEMTQELSGEVTLVTHPGRGNEFIVRLPLEDQKHHSE